MNGLFIGIIIGIVMAGAVGSLLLAMRGQGEPSPLGNSGLEREGQWRLRIGSSEMEWSSRMFEILGATPEAYSPTWDTLVEFVDAEDRERFKSIVDQAVTQGLPFKIELRCLRPSGEPVWIECSGIPDTGTGDAPMFVSGVLSDITALTSMTAERDELRVKLEAAEAALNPFKETVDLESGAVPEAPAAPAAPAEAPAAVKAIARELNNFLTGILGWSQILERNEELPPVARRCVEGIQANSVQANDRIKKLSTVLEAPESGYQPSRKSGEHSASTPAPEGGSGVGAARVLFVDDEPLVVDLFIDMAKSLGFGAFGYTDPEAALTSLQDRPEDFDILVCDLHMPSMPGTELIEQARIIKPSVIVILSSGVRDDLPEGGGGVQPNLLLHKPYSLDTLKETLESAVQIKSGAA